MKYIQLLLIACIAVVSLGAGTADLVVAATVNLQASKDNTLFDKGTGTTSNGAGDFTFIGKTSEGYVHRAVIAFDVAAAIPAGSIINSVTLTVHASKVKNSTARAATLYRLTADWGEGTSNANGQEGKGTAATTGDATWIHRFYNTLTWATPGGDFNPVSSATLDMTGIAFYSFTGGSLVTDVQTWLDIPGTNFGWIIRGDETVIETAKRLDTRENATVANRPVLTITYSAPVPTGACCHDGTCDVTSAAACAGLGGVYQGDDTSCSPDPCPPPTGACCFNDGTCGELTEADCLAQNGTYRGDNTTCTTGLCPVILEPFVDPMPIPPVAVPVTGTPGGTAEYVIDIVEVQKTLHRDLPPTTVWAYDSLYPGPTILASTDQPVTVTWHNNIRDPEGVLRTTHFLPVDLCLSGPDTEGPTPRTVAHLHGAHVEQSSDGYPMDTILPGEQQIFYYPNHQSAATLWYHDHAMGITRLNVMMGLAGFYVLQDAIELALDLPSGIYDIGMAIQDRSFNADGSLKYPAAWEEHFFGDKMLVNGKVWPYLNVEQGKYRFRWLNGCNSRSLTLHLSNGAPFEVIGTEGGLLPAPVQVDSLTITPGERYDVVVDFAPYSAGTEIILTNSAPSMFPGTPGVGVIPNVMKFIVQPQAGETDPLPLALRPLDALADSVAVMHRDFLLQKIDDACAGSIWTINGLHFEDITEKPVINTAEVWRFINPTGVVHPMHMHLEMFQVLDVTPFTMLNDSIVAGTPQPPAPEQSGWKDTVPVYPGEMVRVITTFRDYLGKYPYHCHIIEHEDNEMMRQFEVVIDSTLVGVGDNRRYALDLRQSYPNPFNPSTTITFQVPERARTRLDVYDVSGRLVVTLIDEELPAGHRTAVWNGLNSHGERVASGIYFYRLSVAGQGTMSRKMVLLK